MRGVLLTCFPDEKLGLEVMEMTQPRCGIRSWWRLGHLPAPLAGWPRWEHQALPIIWIIASLAPSECYSSQMSVEVWWWIEQHFTEVFSKFMVLSLKWGILSQRLCRNIVPISHGYTMLIPPTWGVGAHGVLIRTVQTCASWGPDIFRGRSLELDPWTPFTKGCQLLPLTSLFSLECSELLGSGKVLRSWWDDPYGEQGEVLNPVPVAE